jgi:hypothetical protein
MNAQAAWIVAIGIAFAGIFSGGIYASVPAGVGGQSSGAAVYIVNRFTGSATYCGGPQCYPAR